MSRFPLKLILLALPFLTACTINVTQAPAGETPAAGTAAVAAPAEPSEKPVTTFSRHMLVTFEPRRMPHVDRNYLQSLLAPPAFQGLRLEPAGLPAQPRQLWRVDGLRSQGQFFALMESIAHRPEVLAVKGTNGVAPPMELKPLIRTPKPGVNSAEKRSKLQEVELILGMEANSQPPAGEVLEGFAKQCLRKGEALEYERAMAGNAYLIEVSYGGNGQRLKQLMACLGRMPGVRFVEENRRYRLMPNGAAVTPRPLIHR